ncbi:eCIS core domain-containing protein [Haliangium sp.]|uniref:eCIS core domain-containing protein n=1 Tax=Haliangium sp. TaxID=2663208 RepID=UPI003D0E99CC
MSRERWIRGEHDGRQRPHDWRALAEQFGISAQDARPLYEQAQRLARTHREPHRQEQVIFRRLLAEAREAASRPSPGKVTRTMRGAAERAGLAGPRSNRSALTGTAIAPGKRTLTSYLAQPEHQADDSPELERWGREQPSSLGTEHAWPPSEISAAATPARGVPMPLPADTRTHMERVFGHRFDDVVVIPDSPEVSAGQQALTRGREILFHTDAFAPGTARGDLILAHELAHVVQQSRQPATAAATRYGNPHGRGDTTAELEADAHGAALQALAGRAAQVHLAAPFGQMQAFSDEHEHDPDQPPAGPAQAPAPGANPAAATPAAPGPEQVGPAPGPAAPAPGPASASPSRPPPGVPAPMPAPAPAAAGPGPVASAATTSELLVPEAPDALSETAQARLADIDTGIQTAATATTDLPAPEQSTADARAAVSEPQAEQDARAQAGVVAAVDDRPPPSPEIEAACDRIREVIRDRRPPDEDSLVDADPRAMASEAGGEMNEGIETRAGSVRDGYADMESAPPGQPGRQAVPVELPPEQVDTPDIDAGAGVPDELTTDDVSLDADLSAQQQRLEDAGMTTEPALLVEDGPIADARAGVGDLEAMAAADPAQVLADQAVAIAEAAGDMQALQEAAELALAQARAGTVQTLGTRSTEITGSEEEQRARAGAEMQGIFTQARQDVDNLLAPLGETALARWNAGVEQLATGFETSLSSVRERIEERYESEADWNPVDDIGAFFTRVSDDVFGLPDWVVEGYDSAEQIFADGCTDLIRDISRDVNAVIESCQGIIQQARQDIDAIVTGLPEELQAWALGEAARLGTELDSLESQVTDTQQSLNQDLIDRSNQAVQEVRERVHELREQARGVVGRIADAVTAFLEDPGRAIVDGLLRVLGIPPANFWALVDQLGAVVDGIAADPLGFANTLMAGVGQGFEQFFGNFPTHLGQSLFSWLFSRLGEAGVTMPPDFSVPSIVSLVLDVLGISWARIRTLLARHIGEENVAHIERAYDIITTFIARGPLGLVELLREQLDPQSIVDMMRETALRYLMETIVTRVATRILMMLNPAGAILQAVEAIYRVLTWVYENAARIFTLIEAVVNGAAQILAGNTAGLAALVEGALVGLMVPVIDFLADYLGLGGIPEAIRDLVLGLQERIERVLDRVIGFVAERARALLGLGGDEDENEDGEPVQIVKTFTMDDEGHTLTITRANGDIDIQMASTPGELMAKVRRHIDLVEQRIQETRGDEQQQQQNVRDALTTFEQNFRGRVDAVEENGDEDELRHLAEEIATALVDLGRRYGIDDLGSLEALDMPENRHDRLIYEILVELKDEYLAERDEAAAAPEGEDAQDMAQMFHRAMAEAEGAYNGASYPSASAYPANVFRFRAVDFFVDHQNNYIVPNSRVGNRHVELDNHVYACSLGALREASDLNGDTWRRRLIGAVSYNHYSDMSSATLRAIAATIATGDTWSEDALTIFLAALIAEPRRNEVANVTNMLVMGDTDNDGGALERMPMTAGGTDSPNRPRDPNLQGVSNQLPPAFVTDQEVAMAKEYYQRAEGSSLPDDIDEIGGGRAAIDWVKSVLRDLMYNG